MAYSTDKDMSNNEPRVESVVQAGDVTIRSDFKSPSKVTIRNGSSIETRKGKPSVSIINTGRVPGHRCVQVAVIDGQQRVSMTENGVTRTFVNGVEVNSAGNSQQF